MNLCKELRSMLAIAAILISLAFSGSENRTSAQELQPIEAVAPVYPVMALNAGVSGTVSLEVQVDQHGVVTSVRTLVGPELLRKVSERAASRWRFRPTPESAGSRSEDLIFVFSLMQGSPTSDDLVPIFLPPYQIEVKGT